ncbi:MAG: tyrosine-type recombinase/integrase [Thermoguttaceae bacterium]|nr:tyrosine-type recombinase/integrase [Thermoguttaceae bacterium]
MARSISKLLRQRRPVAQDGSCRDTARCIINIDGVRRVYSLGRWGSLEAEQNYVKLVQQFYAGNPQPDPPQSQHSSEQLYTAYTQAFLCGVLNQDRLLEQYAIRYARERFAPFSLDDFSMAILVLYQKYLIEIAPLVRTDETGKTYKRQWSRRYVNSIMKAFKRILTWGINNGLLSPVFRDSIRLFPGLTAASGCGLPERPPRSAARDCDVIATLPFLTPSIRDMVLIQRATCMRPSEVCNLKIGDIFFQQDGTAIVDKAKNKIERHGVRRHIAFAAAETEILLRHCVGRRSDEFVFTARQVMLEQWAVQRQKRKTPLTPSQRKRDEERASRRLLQYNDFITVDLYDRTVRRAVLKAIATNPNIQSWSPYQLRHAAYSALSAKYGIDIASKVAGHLSPNLARIYDHSAAEVSQRIAAEQEKGWWEQ